MILLKDYRVLLIIVAGMIACASADFTHTALPQKDSLTEAPSAGSGTDAAPVKQAPRVDASFLTQYRFVCDIYSYAFRKNEFFKRQYLAGSVITIEADIVELFDRLTFFAYTNLDFGLGEVPGNVVFTFLNNGTNLSLATRYRFDRLYAAFSMNHFCYHDIDSKLFPVMYFNTFCLSASPLDFQKSDYWPKVPVNTTWLPQAHPWWKVDASLYLRRLGGLVGEDKLNGFNDRVFDVRGSALLPLYATRTCGVGITSEEILGVAGKAGGKDDAYAYWSVALGAELHLRGRESFVVYCTYTLDDMPQVIGLPRFSKDQLLQIGIRFLK